MDLDHQNIQMDKWIHAAVKPEIRTFDASETWFENVKLAYIMPACMGSAYLKFPKTHTSQPAIVPIFLMFGDYKDILRFGAWLTLCKPCIL